jgi:hypothetical protein
MITRNALTKERIMKYRGLTIVAKYEHGVNARPPRRGEGTQWISCGRALRGYTIKEYSNPDYLVGGSINSDLSKDSEARARAYDAAKEAVDDLIARIMSAFNCNEREAVKLIKSVQTTKTPQRGTQNGTSQNQFS